MNQDQNPFDEMPIISSYTRKQAIEDSVLVDLTEWAKKTGFSIPVACTSAVWNHIEPCEEAKEIGQDVRGRAHDLLWMLYCAIRRGGDQDQRLMFEVRFQNKPRRHETVTFKSMCGPGDAGEPVITIMMPDED